MALAAPASEHKAGLSLTQAGLFDCSTDKAEGETELELGDSPDWTANTLSGQVVTKKEGHLKSADGHRKAMEAANVGRGG